MRNKIHSKRRLSNKQRSGEAKKKQNGKSLNLLASLLLVLLGGLCAMGSRFIAFFFLLRADDWLTLEYTTCPLLCLCPYRWEIATRWVSSSTPGGDCAICVQRWFWYLKFSLNHLMVTMKVSVVERKLHCTLGGNSSFTWMQRITQQAAQRNAKLLMLRNVWSCPLVKSLRELNLLMWI